MTKPFDVSTHVEIWKQAVETQQHFNEIGWKIRALGLTALTFTFGATFVAYTNAEPLAIMWKMASPACLIPIIGLALWLSFWFMDAAWYHRLLVGASREVTSLENLLAENGVVAHLGHSISSASRVWFLWTEKGLHSTGKLNFYYIAISVVLLTSAGFIYSRGA